MAGMNGTRADIDALNNAISTFDTKKMEMENAYLKIFSAVHALEDTWTGSSSMKFGDKFDEMYKNLETVSPQIDSAVAKIRTAIQEYEGVEDAAQSAINALDAGDVSYF